MESEPHMKFTGSEIRKVYQNLPRRLIPPMRSIKICLNGHLSAMDHLNTIGMTHNRIEYQQTDDS